MNNNKGLENIDILELSDRYNFLVKEYAQLSLDLAVKVEKFGKMKSELELLTVEFVKRGFKSDQPESLKTILEEAIKERDIQS